jgi:hypothetical protein
MLCAALVTPMYVNTFLDLVKAVVLAIILRPQLLDALPVERGHMLTRTL